MKDMESCSSPCNYEEVALEQRLLFSDSLKDLKNLRSQLYSAADYFEVSYTDCDEKQIVVNTLRDYTINALVSTVDHLGSVTYKVTSLLDKKTDEVTGTELRVACIEQRLRTCQESANHEGLAQQSLAITAPLFRKRYILPAEHGLHSALIRDVQPSPIPQTFVRPGSFLFTENRNKPKATEKRSMSPLRYVYPLLRTGSLLSRSSTPRSSRPTTPTKSRPRGSSSSRPTTPAKSHPTTPASSRPTTPAAIRPRASTKPTTPASSRPVSPPRASTQTRQTTPNSQKPSATHLRSDRGRQNDTDEYTTKTKRLFAALLSRHKAKHDDTLYKYLDEY